uniref:BESS domain-containing protein n=1 Tax=Glossina pallidipes TaxID=7398 RepID=A0A1A9ZFG9_GLOPL
MADCRKHPVECPIQRRENKQNVDENKSVPGTKRFSNKTTQSEYCDCSIINDQKNEEEDSSSNLSEISFTSSEFKDLSSCDSIHSCTSIERFLCGLVPIVKNLTDSQKTRLCVKIKEIIRELKIETKQG